MPRVSVLLPYRNAGETIAAAIESVLADADRATEVIAIDDGSSDAGPAIVASMARSDPRVVETATGGVGIAAALMHGLTIARGELVARMDGDDLWMPGRLAAQLDALARAPDVAVVGTRVTIVPDPTPGMQAYVDWQNALLTPREHARDLFVESPLCHPSVLIRRSALEAVGGWRNVGWPEDYDLWLRLDAMGFGLAKVPMVGLRWRHSAGRATFSDPLYARERFVAAKAGHLARRLHEKGLPVVVWGAGPTGKRLARALEAHGIRASAFIDIDPRKIGRVARHAPIVPFEDVGRGACTIVLAVGSRGARALIRARLDEAGFVEGDDYIAAA